MITLYPDQLELQEKVRDSIRRGNKAVLMQAATGSGKTQISASIIASSQKKGKKAIFIVPRRELRKQTSKTFSSHGIAHSFVSSGLPFNPYAQSFIATAGSLVNRLNTVADMDLVVCDEIHHAGASMDKIINFYKARGAIILGLSATPTKLSGQGLDCWFDDMVCGKSIRWLIDNKRLADYRLFAPDTPDLSGVKMVAGDYNQSQLAQKMENDRILMGNAVKHYKTHALGMLGVTYTTSRKHSEIVAEQFRNSGVPAANIDGTMDDAERERIIKAFARRELLQLVNCELLTFGFDLASAAGMDVTIESLTDLQPTQSLAKQMQKWGRVLRMKPNPAMIFDHSGNCVDYKGEVKHGLPCEDRQWSLQGKPKKSSGEKEHVLPVMTCPKCYWCCKPTLDRKCPNCGYITPVRERNIEEREGELKELERKELVRKNKQQQGQARTLDELIALGKSRGYKNSYGWAKFVINARQAK